MDEILNLKEKTEEKHRLEMLLQKTLQEKTDLNIKLTQLTALVKKEFGDVQKLEGAGLTALFYSLLGNKVEKLDKERQEYLAAKLKYENCKNELEQLQIEIDKIKIKIAEIGNPEAEYKKLLETKSLKIKEKQDSGFLKFEELLEIQFVQKKEINEAIDAGDMAIKGLRFAINSLQKAKNWGTYDLLGGGLLATAVKHSNIDEAKQIIQDTQVWLKKFKRELSDVHFENTGELTVQLDSFSTFADYFFDNLIFDWVVQSKINRSLEGCETMYNQVKEMLTHLRISDIEITQKYRQTKKEFTVYIEKTEL